jgi:hypothetical protein
MRQNKKEKLYPDNSPEAHASPQEATPIAD